MSCITTETAMNASNYVLDQMIRCDCQRCANEAFVEKMRRRIAADWKVPYAILFGTKGVKGNGTNMPRGQEQSVSAKPTVSAAHDLSLLIRNKSGDGPRVVVNNIDSKTLNDILDIADEIVISRVDAK